MFLAEELTWVLSIILKTLSSLWRRLSFESVQKGGWHYQKGAQFTLVRITLRVVVLQRSDNVSKTRQAYGNFKSAIHKRRGFSFFLTLHPKRAVRSVWFIASSALALQGSRVYRAVLHLHGRRFSGRRFAHGGGRGHPSAQVRLRQL